MCALNFTQQGSVKLKSHLEGHTNQLRSKLLSVDLVNIYVSDMYSTFYKKEFSNQPEMERLQQETIGKHACFDYSNKMTIKKDDEYP